MTRPVSVSLMFAMAVGLATGCSAPGVKEGAAAAPAPNAVVLDLVLPVAGAPTTVTQEHFVTNWALLGPFTFKQTDFGGDQQQASIDKEFMPNEGALDGTQKPPAGAAWKTMKFTAGANAGQIDLDPIYGELDHAAVYAVAWLNSPQDIPDARVYVGSDDYLKVWVNGKLVHTYNKERRAAARDQDVARGVTLRKGPNRIVVKCVDVVLGWDFYFRVTDAQGRPILVRPKP